MIRAVEFLVSRGHKEEDVIKRYSLHKLLCYYDAGMSNQRIVANVMRAAFGADKKEYEKFLKMLG